MEEETTPNISSMSDQELRDLIDKLTAEEHEVSYRRRILHGQIDLLRAELVNRLRDDKPDAGSLIQGADVEKLSQILAGKAEPPTKPPSDVSGYMHQVYIYVVVYMHGAALVIRSGGGRAGESFTLDDEKVSIGRTPEAGVFLDDVTVSRNHALLVRRKDGLYIDDLGSLNGTYVNRHRIESHQLTDGDEIQIGKYKLSYLEA